MISREVVLTYDFHARPSAYFVNEASKISSSITMVLDNKIVNAKSILGIMSLELIKGDSILIRVDGVDEEEGMKKIQYIVDNPLEDDW